MASAPDLQASAEPCPAASRLQPGPAQGKLRRLSAPSLGAAMLKRLSLVVPLLAMPLLLDGCTGCELCAKVCPDFCFEVYREPKPRGAAAA